MTYNKVKGFKRCYGGMNMQEPDSKKQQTEAQLFDEWVKKFFLDPHTQILDAETFFIDIYESDDEYFIEAALENYKTEDLSVRLQHDALTISVHDKSSSAKQGHPNIIERVIHFPFSLYHHQIRAEYAYSLLTIRIHKFHTCPIQTTIKIE